MSCHRFLRRLGVLLVLGGACAAASAAELMLREERLVQTPEGRQQLKYLVSCALPEGTTLVAQAGEERLAFPGGMGLAPDWATRPMTEVERRRVSACMLARTNAFGVPVLLSIRSDAADVPTSLRPDEEELRTHPYFEAGFFGDIFKERPEGYVCTGPGSPVREPHLRSLLRVCSLPDTGAGSPARVSRCGFLIAGPCAQRPFRQNGTDYESDALMVYLPGPR